MLSRASRSNLKEQRPAFLLLEDGSFFSGKSLGKIGTTGGEVCFNTGMTGYQEIYSDPSYFGQIIINTHPHIGNYGVHQDEDESDGVKFSGLICNEFSSIYSREDAEGSLQDHLEAQNIVGISHLDTRGLVKHLRSNCSSRTRGLVCFRADTMMRTCNDRSCIRHQ